jgi:hypothetical protein
MRQASRALTAGEDPWVSLRKIGAMPNGFTIGNKPAKTPRKAIKSSCMANALSRLSSKVI